MESLPIVEAAQRLGVHPETLRRRIRRGEVKAHQERTPHGDVWMVDVDLANQSYTEQSEDTESQVNFNVDSGEIAVLREMTSLLKDELAARDSQIESWKQQLEAKDRQIEQLHVLMQQTQVALPGLRVDRPWWRFW